MWVDEIQSFMCKVDEKQETRKKDAKVLMRRRDEDYITLM
jgi:hypothetical protein